MFVLLRHLHQLKRSIAQPAPAGRGSLALRHVDCGSCNGCEHELTAAANPYYDLQQYGLNVVASPRHADVLLVTGAITTRMAGPLRTAYDAMPAPRLVAALGDCAIGCNVLGARSELAGALDELLPVDIRIPGCPPTPAQIAEHLLAAIPGVPLGIRARAGLTPSALARQGARAREMGPDGPGPSDPNGRERGDGRPAAQGRRQSL